MSADAMIGVVLGMLATGTVAVIGLVVAHGRRLERLDVALWGEKGANGLNGRVNVLAADRHNMAQDLDWLCGCIEEIAHRDQIHLPSRPEKRR